MGKMKTLQEFLNEVEKQYLYHNTSFKDFMSILEDSEIRTSRKWISFSRSKHYKAAPRSSVGKAEVTFVYDYDKLKQRNKVKPHADTSVVSSDDLKTLSQRDSKWESEELVNSPLPVDSKNGLVEIRLSKEAKEAIDNETKLFEDMIKSSEEKIAMLDKNMFWNNSRKQWVEITTDKQKRVHNYEKYSKTLELRKELLDKFKSTLSKYSRYFK